MNLAPKIAYKTDMLKIGHKTDTPMNRCLFCDSSENRYKLICNVIPLLFLPLVQVKLQAETLGKECRIKIIGNKCKGQRGWAWVALLYWFVEKCWYTFYRLIGCNCMHWNICLAEYGLHLDIYILLLVAFYYSSPLTQYDVFFLLCTLLILWDQLPFVRQAVAFSYWFLHYAFGRCMYCMYVCMPYLCILKLSSVSMYITSALHPLVHLGSWWLQEYGHVVFLEMFSKSQSCDFLMVFHPRTN